MISVVFIGRAEIFQLVCIAEVLFITAQQTTDMIQCSLELSLTFMGYGLGSYYIVGLHLLSVLPY